jgi:hypothetical protein
LNEIEKMIELRISNDLSLPKEAVTWVFAYVAKRGAGKTYNAAVQAEEMLKAGIPIGVIDGMGIWWGLRSSADGKGAGLPIVVFGGEHADLPLVPERSTEMAKAIVESNISFVLDLSGFSKTLMRKIVQAFLDELYRINRVERHVFIEESDMFAPQKPFGPEAIMCLSAVDNFIRRGGNHNLGCTLITQRSAVLNKDLLTQADCLVILRTLAPQDKEAIQAWVKEQTEEDKDKLKVFYDSLKDLENGEAWVWHPEKPSIYCRVKFRQRETFHATREFILNPQASQIKLMNVGEFVSKFKTIFEQGQVSPVDASVKPSVEKCVDKYAEHNQRLQKEVGVLQAELEEFRSGRKLADSVQQRLKFLGEVKLDLEKRLEAKDQELKDYDNLKIALRLALNVQNIYDNITRVEELAKKLPAVLPTGSQPSEGPAAVAITETIPDILHRVERPTVEIDESNNEGRLLTLVINGLFDEKRRLGEIAKEIDRRFAVIVSNYKRDLTPALERLIQLKILRREEESGKNGWCYWLVDGAKDRIKEAA